jgi:hypothetical protein
MEKHFVTFFSPGTFVSEISEHAINSWDVDAAIKLSNSIVERHGAKPYGFRFMTRSREDNELDSKVTETSNMYYLGGKVYTKAEVFARNDPDESVLRSNMEFNNIDRIIVNTNSYKITLPLNEGDIVLP